MKIIYEDRELMVVYKEAGLAVETRRPLEKDLMSLLKVYLAERDGKAPELYLIHRIDQVVDGWAWYRYHATRQGVSAASWGYIPEDGLVYMDRTDPTGTAVLAKNGKTSGKAKINVRFRPTTKARKILELPIGTQVDVYGSENGWTEIEWNRFHGYVKNEFLRDIE